MRRTLCCAGLLAASLASAQSYRWQDAQGQIQISDTPPPRQQAVRTLGPEIPATPAQSYALQRAQRLYPVTLYVSANCATLCDEARALLRQRGVPFREQRVERSEEINALKAAVGAAEVPTLQVGNQWQRGLQASEFQRLLDQAGYPGSPRRRLEAETPDPQ